MRRGTQGHMAHRTRANAMWHTRPHGRAAGGPREAQVMRGWRGHVEGVHASPHGHPGGATWQEGWQVNDQWVSGP